MNVVIRMVKTAVELALGLGIAPLKLLEIVEFHIKAWQKRPK